MKKVFAMLAIVSVLATIPSLAFAADLVKATLSVESREGVDGLAEGPNGDLYVGVSSARTTRLVTRMDLGRVVTDRIDVPSTGEIRRVTASGATSVFANLRAGPLNGLAFGPNGRHLYVALASKEAATHGIWRIDALTGVAERFAVLPTSVEPVELRFRGDDLFVSANGSIYRITTTGQVPVVSVWKSDPLLRGRDSETSTGATGIAFTTAQESNPIIIGGNAPVQEYLYAANTDFGRIVRIPVLDDGSAGAAEIFFASTVIVGARGVAFDAGRDGGTLFVAVSSTDRLVAISPAPGPRFLTVLEGGTLHSP